MNIITGTIIHIKNYPAPGVKSPDGLLWQRKLIVEEDGTDIDFFWYLFNDPADPSHVTNYFDGLSAADMKDGFHGKFACDKKPQGHIHGNCLETVSTT